jgi:NDP-mannose synthase
VVVHHHAVPLPYGVFTIEDGLVVGIEEKPTIHLPVATGMYALSRAAIDALPAGRCDMPALLNNLAAQQQVRAHVIEGFWTDVADLAAYEAVNLDAQRWADL